MRRWGVVLLLLTLSGALAASTTWTGPTTFVDSPNDCAQENKAYTDNSQSAYCDKDLYSWWGGYDLSSIPAGATINGISVALKDAYSKSGSVSFAQIKLSWDGRSSWTSVETSTQITETNPPGGNYSVGGSTDTWGHSWTVSELQNNFWVEWKTVDGSSNKVYVDWLIVKVYYTQVMTCGNAACDYGETYSTCPEDCCDDDCTATTDSSCHSACDTYNGCAYSDSTAKTQCDGQSSGSSVCYDNSTTVSCCEEAPTSCLGTEASCYCTSGSCQTCSESYYCPTGILALPACSSCPTTCDDACSDSACYGTDPDCDVSGGSTVECCGNSNCASGEACSSDCSAETYCSDGIDNDQDGFTDSVDSDCGGTETSCSDGTDNDGDGLVDCTDTSDCTSGTSCGGDNLCCSSACTSVSCSNDAGCDDSNACTIDTCNDASVCGASCSYVDVSACTGGDGCCPSGCTSTNDTDCSAGCGNDVCEVSETCSNCPGDCGCLTNELCCSSSCVNPCDTNTECSDSNACTTDVCNYAGTCNYACAYTSVTTCSDSDSCCPSECTLTNDDDCSTSCGNGNCETGETCSTCATDCGACSTVCGNNNCETGETCSSCSADCGECATNVTVTTKTPVAGTSYALGSNIAVSITFDQSVDSAQAILGSEVATLTDSDSDLTYDGSITATHLTSGSNNLVFTYVKDSESFNESISININTALNLTLNLNDHYYKSDLMKLNGTLIDSNGNPVSDGLININLTSGDWIYKLTAKTDSTGLYETDYLISFANPDGDWTISAAGSDDYGNSGNYSTIMAVSIPEEQLYNIRFYSPISGGKYVRGQKVTVTIEVTKGGQGVSGANVTALSPSGQLLNFSEQATGLYTTEYDIPLNEPAGTWSISTQAVKLIDGTIAGGGDFLNIKIEPLTLIIDLLSPGGNSFNIGSLVDFRLKASYPGGEPLRDGTVKLELANKSFIFIPEGDGVYSTSLDILEELKGTWDSLISASDLSGNSGLLIKVLRFEIPPWYIEYFYYILVSVIVIGFFTTKMAYSKVSEGMKIKSLSNYKEEIKRITDMKVLVEKEYFHKKIDEETYLNLMRKYEAEMIDINSKIGVLETKIKKKIKKKKEEKKKAETVKEEYKEKIKEEKKKIKEEAKKVEKEEKIVKKTKKVQESFEDELREVQELMEGVQDEVKKIEGKKKGKK